MIGIYHKNFLNLLEEKLGKPVKITSKNIICRCPWCEMNEKKDHYHLHISLDYPMFNCFHCSQGHGFITKLFKALSGSDISEKYIDKDKIKVETIKIKEPEKYEVNLPPVTEESFVLKTTYMKKRLGFIDVRPSSIKGLIFDVYNLVMMNPHIFLKDDDKTKGFLKLKDFLHQNFIGFITENNSTLFFRNMDSSSSFKHYKLKMFDIPFIDYYKLPGPNRSSNTIVLSEGSFDILSESLFDSLGIRRSVFMYAAALSKTYETLIKSIAFYEKIFRPDVVILSDRDVNLNFYKNLLKYNRHIIESLSVYYNKSGKDFNTLPVIPEKFVI